MPKDTFFNLSEEKRKKILNAAVLEFSTRRFSEASINQIIKNAAISRGSFYQYFNDKEDIYLYMITEIGKEKMAVIGQGAAIDTDGDFFETYMLMLKIGLEWAQRKPDYNRIGMLMELDDSQFIAKLRTIASSAQRILRELVERDQQLGRIKPETDPDLIIGIISTLNIHLLKDYLSEDLSNMEGMMNKASEILGIIKYGVAPR